MVRIGAVVFVLLNLNDFCSLCVAAEFRTYFEKFGKVIQSEVMFNRETHKSRGFGFVVFEEEAGAEATCAEAEHVINGKVVEVKRAIPRAKLGAGEVPPKPTSKSSNGNQQHSQGTAQPQQQQQQQQGQPSQGQTPQGPQQQQRPAGGKENRRHHKQNQQQDANMDFGPAGPSNGRENGKQTNAAGGFSYAAALKSRAAQSAEEELFPEPSSESKETVAPPEQPKVTKGLPVPKSFSSALLSGNKSGPSAPKENTAAPSAAPSAAQVVGEEASMLSGSQPKSFTLAQPTDQEVAPGSVFPTANNVVGGSARNSRSNSLGGSLSANANGTPVATGLLGSLPADAALSMSWLSNNGAAPNGESGSTGAPLDAVTEQQQLQQQQAAQAMQQNQQQQPQQMQQVQYTQQQIQQMQQQYAYQQYYMMAAQYQQQQQQQQHQQHQQQPSGSRNQQQQNQQQQQMMYNQQMNPYGMPAQYMYQQQYNEYAAAAAAGGMRVAYDPNNPQQYAQYQNMYYQQQYGQAAAMDPNAYMAYQQQMMQMNPQAYGYAVQPGYYGYQYDPQQYGMVADPQVANMVVVPQGTEANGAAHGSNGHRRHADNVPARSFSAPAATNVPPSGNGPTDSVTPVPAEHQAGGGPGGEVQPVPGQQGGDDLFNFKDLSLNSHEYNPAEPFNWVSSRR
jgi:hypothetical protein